MTTTPSKVSGSRPEPSSTSPQTDGALVVRRAPFSDNPRVGARGQRTQQRILDAALRAFGDEGYHACSIDRITKLARCSRVSFYQYFASKEDLFRHLAGQVARQVSAATEALDPLTADPSGWSALRAWIARYGEIYARYEPVFNAYETDEGLAGMAARLGGENLTRIHSKLATTTLPPRQLDPVIRMLLACLNHTLEVTGILRSASPEAFPAERVEVALCDVLHRTLFGRRDVNVHEPTEGVTLPMVALSPAALELLRLDEPLEPGASESRALDALLKTGRDVFVSRGYYNTRIDDLVAAAGVSHGAFYRHFRNKAELAQILTASAMRATGRLLVELPDLAILDESAGKGALRRWLRRYQSVHAGEAAMLRVWVDAALQDPALRAESAAPLDFGRRRLSRYLGPRGFGDVEMEAVVMVALLGVLGALSRPPAEADAAAHIIERGLLGR
jgi:AcrR family transcriptional regulator